MSRAPASSYYKFLTANWVVTSDGLGVTHHLNAREPMNFELVAEHKWLTLDLA